MLIRRANTLLIYGETGTYKTTNAARFARYIYEQTGKPTRLISADGGGWLPAQAEIDAGIVDALRVVEADQPLSLLRKLSQGYWPVNDKLVLGDVANEAGAYVVESLTSICTLTLRHLVKTGRKISADIVGRFDEKIEADGKQVIETFGAPGMPHYGFVQNFILDLITAFGALPVNRVLFTALEGKGGDDITSQLVYGPATAGKAITDRIPTMVGDLLHFYAAPVRGQAKVDVRCYLDKHPDAQTGIIWPAKPRLHPSQLTEFEKRWPDRSFALTPDAGIEQYLAFQDETRGEMAASVSEWKAGVDARRAGA